MNQVQKYFKVAALNCFKGNSPYNKKKRIKIGAIGVRRDGTIVRSHNLPCIDKDLGTHAERRLCRKLDHGSIVYVVRLGRSNNEYRNCRPCQGCQAVMRSKKVSKCYYSISDKEYGVIVF